MSPASGRTRRTGWILAVVAGLALLIWAFSATNKSVDSTTLSIENFDRLGARAVAEVAKAQGLDLRQIEALSQARITDPENTTVVISDGSLLIARQLRSLMAYPGDVVVFGPGIGLIEFFDGQIETTDWFPGAPGPQCDDPHAIAAGSITSDGLGLVSTVEGSTSCFLGDAGQSLYVVIPKEHGTLTLLASPEILTNGSVAKEGNAALALRVMGGHSHAVWYLASPRDTSALTWVGQGEEGNAPDDIEASPDFLPAGTGNAAYALVITLAVLAWWRARRFGALVIEPLPVVIRASEATRGRARLYKSSRAYGRAGASLRAAAALRMGKRLGVPRGAGKESLLAAITKATGMPRADVESILYAEPPHSEGAMMDLTTRIDRLESEVHGS